MDTDFLIVGQGLAGTVLSFRLMQLGQRVVVFDTPELNKSSRVAAGLYNPITGNQMVKTWYADRLFPEIVPTYRKLEQLLGMRFLVEKKIYRPFLSIEEQNEWMGKSAEPEFQGYFEEVLQAPVYPAVNNSFGGIMLTNSGYVDIPVLLDGYRQYLLQRGMIHLEQLKEEELEFGHDYPIRYRGIKAKALVFCNGLGALGSRFFNPHPFAPVKGEILDLSQPFSPNEIINRGVFRITLSNGKQRVGSTYSWHDLDQGATEAGKNEILEKLHKLVPEPVDQIDRHRFGIRPATKDRKPILGKHPDIEGVYIFNGFGAKGVSLIPYFSNVMCTWMLKGIEPEKEVNLVRWFKT
jgi:glycine/D-amino acid oxidase-like deaminating enzyme